MRVSHRQPWQRCYQKLLLILTAFYLSFYLSTFAASARELNVLCGLSIADSWTLEACREGVERFASATGHKINVVSADTSASETLDVLRELLAIGSDAIDVIRLDVVWTGLLAPYLADLGSQGRDLALRQREVITSAGFVEDKLVAVPMFVDLGVLFYRQDLLSKYRIKTPETWPELQSSIGTVLREENIDERRIDGFIFQGQAYEGLTANALEWLATNSGHGFIVDDELAVNSDELKAVISQAAGWIGEAVPRASLNWTEQETLERFADGRALYMRHWASAAGLLERDTPEIARHTGLAPIPVQAGMPHAGALGGSLVGVSAMTKEPELARELALHLASTDEQQRRLEDYRALPSDRALLAEIEAAAAGDWLSQAARLLDHAILRPSVELGQGYTEFSDELAGAVHAVLAGDADAEVALDDVQRRLNRRSGGGTRW